MELQHAILHCSSIRKHLNEQITDARKSEILKAAMYAPSAVNKQLLNFIVFGYKATIKAEKQPNSSVLRIAARMLHLRDYSPRKMVI